MAKQTSIQFKNWDQVHISLREFQINNKAFTNDVLFNFANYLITEIQRRAPRRTGSYARSWRIRNQTATTITVRSSAPPWLFIVLEFGTRGHLIVPRTTRVLRFTQGSEVIFATSANHPGTRPFPHVRPALRALKRAAPGMIMSLTTLHFSRIMKEVGAKAARQLGFTGKLGRSVGRTTKDVTANIGRGTKGKISAQLTSRKSYKKRIRVTGLRRVGTAEKKKVGFKVGGKKSKSGEQTFP